MQECSADCELLAQPGRYPEITLYRYGWYWHGCRCRAIYEMAHEAIEEMVGVALVLNASATCLTGGETCGRQAPVSMGQGYGFGKWVITVGSFRKTYGKDPYTTSRQTEVLKRGASYSAANIRIDDQFKYGHT